LVAGGVEGGMLRRGVEGRSILKTRVLSEMVALQPSLSKQTVLSLVYELSIYHAVRDIEIL